MEKAQRNKTLELSDLERRNYSDKIIEITQPVELADIADRTLCGDTLQLLPILPDGFADLIIVDPPYNLDKDFNGLKFKSSSNKEYTDYLRSWLPMVCRKLKSNGSLYLCGDWRCTAEMQTVLSENLQIINRITWQREKGRGAKENWKNSMEDIWFAVKDANSYTFNVDNVKMRRRVIAPYKVDGKPKDWEETEEGNFRLTYPSNFWDDISVPYWSMPENTEHPTQKPEKLIAKLILASSNKNDIIFDPFLGSGTTSVVAKKLHRHYCGIEINREYCCWAEKRLALANCNPEIQGYVNGVFWERNTSAIQDKAKRFNNHNSQPNLFQSL